MSSILHSQAAVVALSMLRGANKTYDGVQSRVSTGLKVQSGKDNAAYFSIAKTMEGESSIYTAIAEGMAVTENTLNIARLGAERLNDEFQKFAETTLFMRDRLATSETEVFSDYKREIDELVVSVIQIVENSSYSGVNLLALDQPDFSFVLGKGNDGVIRDEVVTDKPTKNSLGDIGMSPIRFVSDVHIDYSDNVRVTNRSDLSDPLSGDLKRGSTPSLGYSWYSAGGAMKWLIEMRENFGAVAFTQAHWEDITDDFIAFAQFAIEDTLNKMLEYDMKLKTIAESKSGLKDLCCNLDSCVGAMIDADMETEAAKLQAIQVQQQLGMQSLAIANRSQQHFLSLF